jgi:hypothetical protein
MFEFGRELKRIFGATGGRLEADPSLLELLDASMLASQGKACDISAGRVSTRDPFRAWLESAAVWREHARRSGDPATLRKAASSAQSAVRAARATRETGRAALEQALISLTGVDLFGDVALLETARDLLDTARAALGEPVFDARLEAAWARLKAREALAQDDYSLALEAAALFDSAVHRLERLAADRANDAVRLDAALIRIERADLIAGFGVRRRETRLLEAAAGDAEGLLKTLNADYEPLTWAHAAEVLGTSLVSLGEMQGRTEHIAEGVSWLAQIGERFTRDHSPLDWARFQHALGVGLQSLGEACDNDSAFVQAARALDEALDVLGTAPVAMRCTIANNRAACLARSAERSGDLVALSRAEAAFKAELATLDGRVDPVAWAVLQVNLARVYEARAELVGAFREREAAVYALEEAIDVFCNQGLKGLAETACDALLRVRDAAG